MEKTYPDLTFEGEARKRGAEVRVCWGIPGPAHTQVAWIVCYIVNDSVAIVETYKGQGWHVFTPAPVAGTEESVTDAVDRCTLVRFAA
jgi:hypothetical protein